MVELIYTHPIDISEEMIIISKLLGAAVLGAVIGYDRPSSDAGLRTYASVCMGAALFTSIAGHLEDVVATSRIVANVVMGIGFLGAGIVYKDAATVYSKGLTTAATIWCTAAVGVAVGLNMFVIAGAGALLVNHHQPAPPRMVRALESTHQGHDENID